MILLCLCELGRAERGDGEQPGHQGGGHQGTAASSTFLDCILSACAAATVFQTLIYKERTLLAVAEEFLTVLQAGRCWHSGTTFLLCQLKVEEQGVRERPGQAGACSFTISPLCHNTAKMTTSSRWKTKDLVSHLTIYTQGNNPK